MDYLTEQQINAFKSEKEATMNSLSSQQISLAKRLKNGLGEDIVNELNNKQNEEHEETASYHMKQIIKEIKKMFKRR